MSAQKSRCNRPVPPCNDRKTVDSMYANRTEASAIANSHLLNWLKSYGAHCPHVSNMEFDRLISPTRFLSALEDGLLLVNYAESISPGICPNIEPTYFSHDRSEKRIKAFIAFAKERAKLADGCVFYVEDVNDKYEDSYQAVFYTIYKLGVQTPEKFGRHGIDVCKMSDDTYQFLQKKAKYASKQEQLKAKSEQETMSKGVIQISVISQTGHELTYYVLPTDSISELQERIEIDTGLSPAQQRLLCSGRHLFDPDRIMDCGISNGEKIELYVRQYACVIEMPSVEFQRTCRDIAMFSDSLSITSSKTSGSIVFSGKGDSVTNTVTYSAGSKSADDDESEIISIVVREEVKVSYAIKYMNMFTKATSLSGRVRVSLSNNVPMAIEYGVEDNGYIRFYLAPKIEEGGDADMD